MDTYELINEDVQKRFFQELRFLEPKQYTLLLDQHSAI